MNNFHIVIPGNGKSLFVYIGKLKEDYTLSSASIAVKRSFSYGSPNDELYKEDFVYINTTQVHKSACFIIKCNETWDEFANQVFHMLKPIEKELVGLMEYKEEIIQVNSSDKAAIEMYYDKAWFALWDYLHE